MAPRKSLQEGDPEQEAFLGTSDTARKGRRTVSLSTFLTVVSAQALISVLGLYYLSTKHTPCVGPTYTDFGGYYPASEAISYYETTFTQEDIFKTLEDVPTNETDEAWKQLQAPTDGVVQISSAMGFEMDRLLPSITCPTDLSVHQYGLDAHHQLHCLDMVRKSLYPDYYFPNQTQEMTRKHREHCIEHLRQSIMCSGDVTLDRWYWDKNDQETYVLVDTPRVCRDFKKLSAWVEKYQFRKEDWKIPGQT